MFLIEKNKVINHVDILAEKVFSQEEFSLCIYHSIIVEVLHLTDTIIGLHIPSCEQGLHLIIDCHLCVGSAPTIHNTE